jgi:uncharacterized protein YndB with AHSA1/START domain
VTNDRKRTDRVIDLTIDIDATLDEVWQALTTGEGIARWFAPHAAVTPGEGGSVSVGWDPKEMWTQPITVWEPLRRMQTAGEMPSADGRMVRLAVDYHLEATAAACGCVWCTRASTTAARGTTTSTGSTLAGPSSCST